ncbi:alpha/beta hydrolase family protein [Hyphomicrobium sp. 2TAF46]|uniref:alpha/beta hydrolase family protein n=1 Tax=Hyphomicrobium sp. 2TAF46 TaxID=3233019 RepID=UPI003F936E98
MNFLRGDFLSQSMGRSARLVNTQSILIAALMTLTVLACWPARADDRQFGSFGPEGPRMREQLWILPSGEEGRVLRATVFRPEADPSGPNKKYPLVVINHGTDEATRLAVSMPVYYWLSRWFVERGYAVVLPQRRGHGATGGSLSEAIGTCDHPNHFLSGNIAADDIAATIKYMSEQSFVAPKETIVAGVSTGGWASLALAARNLPQVQAIVNFAGGRGGHAYGRSNAVCGRPDLVSAAQAYGGKAHVPTIWFYSENDSYFGPALAEDLAQAWNRAGGNAEEHILPAYGSDGHSIADDRQGWDLWGPSLDAFLTKVRGDQVEVATKGAQPAPQIETSAIATTGATR